MFANNKVWLVGACVFLVAQIILGQHNQIVILQQELRLAEKAKAIENDQIADLAQQLSQLRAEKEFSDVKQFVAGVVAAVNKPEPYAELWHAGYDRGAAVQQYADQLETKTYTSTKDQ